MKSDFRNSVSAGTELRKSNFYKYIGVLRNYNFFSYILISASVFNVFNRLYSVFGILYASASTKSLGSKIFIKKRKRKAVIRPWNNVTMNAK